MKSLCRGVVPLFLAFAVPGAIFCSGSAAQAAEPASQPAEEASKGKGPLAHLPSTPGPHLEKIRALRDNQWLELGPPVADPKWGEACGRSWTPYMPPAPELRGAFLHSMGPHGFVKPDGHILANDLWFYDINAHRWICLDPGWDTKNWDGRINADGFEVDAKGDLLLTPQNHGYEALTYNPGTRRFAFINRGENYSRRYFPQREALLEKEKDRLYTGTFTITGPISPWFYSLDTGKYEVFKTPGADSPPNFFNKSGSYFFYLPPHKKYLFMCPAGSRMDNSACTYYLYDAARNAWEKIRPKGPPPPFGRGATACYDTKRDRIYIGGSNKTEVQKGNLLWIYDVKTHTWIEPKPKGEPCGGSTNYATEYAMMNYDAANDAVVLFRYYLGKGEPPEVRGIYAYDPVKDEWSTASKEIPAPPRPPSKGRHHYSGFYDAELNAHFCYMASDGAPGPMLVYRYRRGQEAKP
ncbi:MAG: hypothetical protein BIFFINMI_02177 [Phycisphaerae bacterium]|nr:hypothetical protein [Phycisphaerae bacterium]